MKMLLKSNKGSGNLPPLQNIINDNFFLEEFAYDDEEKCAEILFKVALSTMILDFSWCIWDEVTLIRNIT
jgi:hypothetical protein